MKKLLWTVLFCTFFVTFGYSQIFRIALRENTRYCCGYGLENVANLYVEEFPGFDYPPNTGIIYNWYMVHPNVTRTWNTPVDRRSIALPWSGTYRVWAQIYFIDKTTLQVYGVFRSNVLTFEAMDCEKQAPHFSIFDKDH
jgi:hypothetical protein